MFIDLTVPIKCGKCGSLDIVRPVNQSMWAAEIIVFRCADCGHEKHEESDTAKEMGYGNTATGTDSQPTEITF